MKIKNLFYRIGYNTGIQIIGKGLSVLLSFLSVSLLTRYLGETGYGNFTLIFTYAAMFSIFSDLGLHVTLVRELTKQNAHIHYVLATYFRIKIALSVLYLLIAGVALFFFPYSIIVKQGILIGLLAVAVSNFSGFGSPVFQAKLRLDFITLIDVISRASSVLLIIFGVWFHLHFYFIVATVLFGNICGLLLQFILLDALIQLECYFDWHICKRLLWATLPVGITLLFSLTAFKLDVLLLSFWRPIREVGLYNVSYKVMENILILWLYYMASIYPLFTMYAGKNQWKKIRALLRNSVGIISIFSVVIIIIGYIIAPFVIEILGGKSFADSVISLRILLFAVPFFCLTHLWYFYNVTFHKNRILLSSVVFSLGVNFILNVYVIPRYGFIGASYTTIITEVLLCGFYSICFFLEKKPLITK